MPETTETGTYKITSDTIVSFKDNSRAFFGKLVNEQLSLKKENPETVSYYKDKRTFVGKIDRYYDDCFTIKYFYSNNRLKTKCILKYKRGDYYKTEYEEFYETGAIKTKGILYKRYRLGKWIYFSENGDIMKKEKWVAGQLHA